MSDLKRIAAPRTFPVKRKSGGKYVVTPLPGPHPKSECIPLNVVLRDVLGVAETAKEAKEMMMAGKIKIDGKERKRPRYPVGIFDVLGAADDNMRLIPSITGFKLVETQKGDEKLCKILDKTKIKGGKTQLNLNDGKNIIVDKDSYSTGDTVIVSLPDLKIKDTIERKKGALAILTRGTNRGKTGTIESVNRVEGVTPNTITLDLDGRTIQVPEEIIFVIGDKKPAVELE